MIQPVAFSTDILIVLLIMGLTIGLFLFSRARADGIAVVVLILLGLTQVVPAEHLFSGFSSQAVMALLGIMMLSAGLDRAGVMDFIARYLDRWGQHNETRLIIGLGIIAGLLAALIQNFGAVLLLLPVVNQLALRSGIARSRLLLPMAMCAIAGSVGTLIGASPLLLLNDLMRQSAHSQVVMSVKPFHVLALWPLGLVLWSVVLLYVLLIGRRSLPNNLSAMQQYKDTLGYFKTVYGVGGPVSEWVITENSPLAYYTLKALEAKLEVGVSVVALTHKGEVDVPPQRKMSLCAGMSLAIMGEEAAVQRLVQTYALEPVSSATQALSERLNLSQVGLAEVTLPPWSSLVGKAVRELHMRRQYEMQMLALHRGKRIHTGQAMRKVNCRPGDIFAVFCAWPALQRLAQNNDFVVLTRDYPCNEFEGRLWPRALACVVLALALVLSPGVPVALGLWVGAIAMVVTRVLPMDTAYAAISWRTLFLLSGLIPLGVAAQHTGAAQWLATYLLQGLSGAPHEIIVFFFAVLATVLALAVSNVGATVILVPIAMQVATLSGGDPRFMALLVAVACNNAFMLPSHQVNVLILGTGEYSQRDFFRVAGPVTLAFWLLLLLLLPFCV